MGPLIDRKLDQKGKLQGLHPPQVNSPSYKPAQKFGAKVLDSKTYVPLPGMSSGDI